jgi:hypothetical protein
LHPPIEYDDTYYRLNLSLARDHVLYQNVKITFPASGVVEFYPQPSHLRVSKDGTSYILTGRVNANEPLGIEVLMTDGTKMLNSGRLVKTSDVMGKIHEANLPKMNILKFFSTLILYAGCLAGLLLPIFLILIYRRFGREKEFVVPEYLTQIEKF